MPKKLLIKVEIPSGSHIFKNIKMCFLTDDPRKLTRQYVLYALQRKIRCMLEDPEPNKHIINNYVCCYNGLKANSSDDKWLFMDGERVARNLVLDSEYTYVVRFHLIDWEEIP